MKRRDGQATWLVEPAADAEVLRLRVTFDRAPGAITLEARVGYGGWQVARARSRVFGSPDLVAGLVSATIDLPGRPPLVLSWPPGLPPGVSIAAAVSDVRRLVAPGEDDTRQAVAALYDSIRRRGPLTGTGWKREEIVAELAQWDGEWPPTQEAAAGFRGLPGARTLSRRGWPEILREAAVLREETTAD